MRRRFQNGSIFKRSGSWVIAWWEDGHRRKRTLGRIGKITKAEAQKELAGILAPLNCRESPPSKAWVFSDFVERVYFPFFVRKWKRSTAGTNKDRMKHHLVSEFGSCTLGSFNREQ